MAKQGKGGGCAVIFGGLVLLGLVVEFWYVALGIVAIVILIKVAVSAGRKRRDLVASAAKAREQIPALGVLQPDQDLNALTDQDVVDMHRALTGQAVMPAKYRDIIVPFASLGAARPVAERACKAVTAILASAEYKAGNCGAVGSNALLSHSWDMAVALREITERHAELPSGDIGPITAPVVAAQSRALKIAENATEARVSALENYAAQVAKADAARRDWNTAQAAAQRNDQYLDLVARTAADEHATADLGESTAAAQILQETLADAANAAETLIL